MIRELLNVEGGDIELKMVKQKENRMCDEMDDGKG